MDNIKLLKLDEKFTLDKCVFTIIGYIISINADATIIYKGETFTFKQSDTYEDIYKVLDEYNLNEERSRNR